LVKKLFEKQKEAFIRQEYELGEECEFDWGDLHLKINGAMTKCQLAVFTTCAGNYRYCRLFKKQDTASFQEAHAHFFQKIGGVFKKMTYDNMRVVVKKFVGKNVKEATEGLLQLSTYYLFRFRFCNVYRGNEKGHVERSVEVVRRKVFSKKIEFSSFASANEYLEKGCDKLNEKKPYGATQTSAEILNKEQKYLIKVRPFFETSKVEQLKVDKYSTITFEANRYSVPDKYVGKCMTVRIYPSVLKISYNDEKLCEHERLIGQYKWALKIEHYLSTLKRKPGALRGSLMLKQIAVELKKIYDKYYKNDAKGFIELLDYMKKNEVKIKEIQVAIKELEPIKSDDILTDKIERICEKNKEEKTKKTHQLGIDEIEKSSKKQLNAIAKLFDMQVEPAVKTITKDKDAA